MGGGGGEDRSKLIPICNEPSKMLRYWFGNTTGKDPIESDEISCCPSSEYLTSPSRIVVVACWGVSMWDSWDRQRGCRLEGAAPPGPLIRPATYGLRNVTGPVHIDSVIQSSPPPRGQSESLMLGTYLSWDENDRGRTCQEPGGLRHGGAGIGSAHPVFCRVRGSHLSS